MNFGAIQTALRGNPDVGLFSANVTVSDWIIASYAKVWSIADWPFKKVGPTSLSLTGATQTVTAPADCLKPYYVYDDQDSPLSEASPLDFFRQYGTLAATSSGDPRHYCFFNGVFYFGPTPSANRTFKLVYEKKKYVLDAAGTGIVNGDWDGATTTQQPAWDAGFHFVLVHEAAAIGYTLLGSPLADRHFQMGEDTIQRMVQFYAPFDHASNYQFTRDSIS